MAIEITMPKLGLTMDEGTINSWLIKEGETIDAGKTLLIVETDKVTIDVESPATGTLLKILVNENESVPIGTVIGYIGNPGETIPEKVEKVTTQTQKSAEPVKPMVSSPNFSDLGHEKPFSISPIARKLALENKIDIAMIHGSGPGGRIVETDVQKLIIEKTLPVIGIPFRSEKISLMKRITAQRMTESFREIPHFYLQKQLIVDRLTEMRENLKKDFDKHKLHLTFTDLFIKALAVTLAKYPLMNASWVGEEIHAFTQINIGFAVATPKGLIVAVIRNTQNKNLAEIASERAELALKARDNRLTPENITEGTFTLTNLGMYHVDNFLPIINIPQSGILAVGEIKEASAVVKHQIGLHQVLQITLAADHRVVDGVQAAEFLEAFSQMISNEPESIK